MGTKEHHGRRPYIRIPRQLGFETWTNDQVATIVRLQCLMGERWARERLSPSKACIIRLSGTDQMHVTGKHRRDVAAKSLRSLADIAEISARLLGDVVEITWHKWAEEQGLYRGIAGKYGLSSPSPSPSPFNRSSSGMSEPVSEPASEPTSDPRGPAPPDRPPRKNSHSVEGKKNQPKAPPKLPPEIARQLAAEQLAAIQSIQPTARAPSPAAMRTWAVEMDRLVRLDRRTPEQIRSMLAWLYAPQGQASRDALFWRVNVRSPAKLRDQWDRLAAIRLRPTGGTNGTNGTRDVASEAAAEILEEFDQFIDERFPS